MPATYRAMLSARPACMRPLLALPVATVLFVLVSLFAPARLHAQDFSFWLPVVISEKLINTPWPPDNMLGVSPNTWLTWEYDGEDADELTWHIYLDDTPPYAEEVVGAGVERTFFDLPTLKSGWRYYWRVVGFHPDGTVAIYGPSWTFRTEVADEPLNLEAMVSIPAGELQMGCDPENDGGYGCRPREVPLHTVWVDAFDIDKYEVTNSQYAKCVAAGACDPPRFKHTLTREWYYGNPEYDEYPVVYVSWWNANDYCAWADKRLPTEAEWEMAARGPYDTRPWPWGDETIDCTRANFTDTRPSDKWVVCKGDTTRVGSYPTGATALGVMDMSGNVFEWVKDVYDENYYNYSPSVNPQGPDRSTDPERKPYFVIRGGSYRPDWYYPRTFNRHWGHHGYEGPLRDIPYFRNNQVGFRCAR